MFFPFINMERFEELSSTEDPNELIKSNLPHDALVLVSFFGDGNGSRFTVHSRNNFSSSDRKVYHARLNFVLPETDVAVAQIARKGSDLYYDSSDFTTGRGSLTVTLLYLPDIPATDI